MTDLQRQLAVWMDDGGPEPVEWDLPPLELEPPDPVPNLNPPPDLPDIPELPPLE
jgi:hypothetical protein